MDPPAEEMKPFFIRKFKTAFRLERNFNFYYSSRTFNFEVVNSFLTCRQFCRPGCPALTKEDIEKLSRQISLNVSFLQAIFKNESTISFAFSICLMTEM